MTRLRYHFPKPHVHRPEPGLESSMNLLLIIALLSVIALLWSGFTGVSLSPLSWYIVRASGFSLYLLSWFLVIGGLGTTTKLMVNTGNRGVALSLHTYAFHLWYGMLALHMLGIVIDPSVKFGIVELVVPFTSDWREPWTGFGVLAAMLGILVGASGAFRRLFGYRAWKSMHWLSLPMFAMGLLHGLLAGTDSASVWAFTLYVVTGGWVVFLVAFRTLRRNQREEHRVSRLPLEQFRRDSTGGDR